MARDGIPMARADLDESDIAAVVRVLRSGRLALGPCTEGFERAVADYVGVPHAVAVSSGTAALHLALEALGIGEGDEVLVPSFTFAASVNAILFRGAQPVFVDIGREDLTVDPSDVERKITRKTKGLMVVDVFGHPADWDALTFIAERNNILLVDDSCEALGAEYRGRKVGGFGEAATFAFYPNKQITTGEGGMLVTRKEGIAQLARSLRNQGRDSMGAWLEHARLGYNYRLDEMSAALGLSQMARIGDFLARREKVASTYGRYLENVVGVEAPRPLDHVRMSWFVYVVRLGEGLQRDEVMQAMEARGVPVRGYFSPIHLQPYIRERFGDLAGTLPITEEICRKTMALPFHNALTEAEIEHIVKTLEDVLRDIGR